MAYELEWNVDGNKWNRLQRRFASVEELWVVAGGLFDVVDPNRSADCIDLKIRKVD